MFNYAQPQIASDGGIQKRRMELGSARVGAEIVLTVGGEWRKTRLFRSHEEEELVGAIADTRTAFAGKGWT